MCRKPVSVGVPGEGNGRRTARRIKQKKSDGESLLLNDAECISVGIVPLSIRWVFGAVFFRCEANCKGTLGGTGIVKNSGVKPDNHNETLTKCQVRSRLSPRSNARVDGQHGRARTDVRRPGDHALAIIRRCARGYFVFRRGVVSYLSAELAFRRQSTGGRKIRETRYEFAGLCVS